MWSKEAPKEPGLYFFRITEAEQPSVCLALYSERYSRIMFQRIGSSRTSAFEWDRYKYLQFWSIPIPPPTEAADADNKITDKEQAR